MARFFHRHTRYEVLLTEHLDGRLDDAGEARLRAHLETCHRCSVELREMESLVGVLRAQPLVEPPRSFALPLTVGHPSRLADKEGLSRDAGFFRWAGNGGLTVLRSMQMATAAAAMVLVAVVALDVSGVIPPQPSADVQLMSAPAESIAMDAAEAGPSADDPHPAAPADPAPGAPAPEEEEPSITAREPSPDPSPGELAAYEIARTVLEWAKLGLSGLTAALALGVVWLAWVSKRPV